MKKTLLIVLILVSFLDAKSSLFNANKLGKYITKNYDPKTINKMSDSLVKSKNISMPNITKKNAVSSVDMITKVAEGISKKSDYANKLISKSDKPLLVINQYAKYGDKYLEVGQSLSRKVIGVSRSTFKQAKNKIADFPSISPMTIKQFNNKFVGALKKTGEIGWDISKKIADFSASNPKSAAVGILYGWFVTHPESFQNALEEFGRSIEEFAKHIGSIIGSTVGSTAVGFIEGLKNGIFNVLGESNQTIVTIIYILLGLWAIRMLLSFLKPMIKFFQKKDKQKYEPNKMDDEEGTL